MDWTGLLNIYIYICLLALAPGEGKCVVAAGG